MKIYVKHVENGDPLYFTELKNIIELNHLISFLKDNGVYDENEGAVFYEISSQLCNSGEEVFIEILYGQL